jgi:hypothetical protein
LLPRQKTGEVMSERKYAGKSLQELQAMIKRLCEQSQKLNGDLGDMAEHIKALVAGLRAGTLRPKPPKKPKI